MPEETDDNLDFLKDVLDDYLVETSELVEQLESDLVALESSPADTDLLNRIFRAVHTIKGTSSFLGFERMSTLTHQAEDVLNVLRRGEKPVDAHVMDVLLKVVDWIQRLLEHIREEANDGDEDLSEILTALENLLKEDSGTASDEKKEAEKAEQAAAQSHDHPAAEAGVDSAKGEEAAQSATEPAKAESAEEKTGTEKVETAPKAENAAHPAEEKPEGKKPEDSGAPRDSAESKGHEAEAKPAEGQPAAAKARPGQSRLPKSEDKGPQTVRVPVERLDEIMDLVGELVLARNRLVQVTGNLTRERRSAVGKAASLELDQLTMASEQIHFVTSQLQEVVMRTRMLPIANAFKRFPRMVRDLAKESGKEVSLVLEGEETELDKSLLELIADPLVHLVRNAVDHGIEMPDEREKAGKPRKGTVVLSAAQEGNHVLISISDDGRGIDPERLKAAAVEKGLISAEEARGLSERDAYNLIFLPGFSTAKKVTGTSGRGVGMDVVKTNISRLSGQIEVESEVGKGTRFVVRLPLTLAITPALLAEVASEVLVIPLASVLETARLRDFTVVTLQGQRAMRLRDTVLPLIDLAQVLGLRDEPFGPDGYAVVIGLANRRVGLVVDELLGQEEIVVKPLGEYLGKMPALAGATILGDGKVRMVLDVGDVLELARNGGPVQVVGNVNETEPVPA